MTKFYNASQVEEVEKYLPENKNLVEVLEFLQSRGLLEFNDDVISFRDGINAVRKYAENFVSDKLTINFAVQMWIAESKLKTKTKKFLPTYSEEILAEIEKNPDRIFEVVNKAQAILKNLRREKTLPIEKLSSEEFYKFLLALKSAEKQKIWIEFFYGDYAHGKFLISEGDFELLAEENVTDFLKKRLDKNRRQILENPQELKKYISPRIMVRVEDILNQINLESENFQSAMKIFEQEEIKYLENNQ